MRILLGFGSFSSATSSHTARREWGTDLRGTYMIAADRGLVISWTTHGEGRLRPGQGLRVQPLMSILLRQCRAIREVMDSR
jgi:hypothetical protein